MQKFEEQYSIALEHILLNGTKDIDRTGTGTLRIPEGINLVYDCGGGGFPALRAKKLNPRNSLIEVIWMLKGLSNIDFLKKNGVNYWDKWADKNGYIGPCYGSQLRHFNVESNNDIMKQIEKYYDNNDAFGMYRDISERDQVIDVVKMLKTNKASRRIILTFWNPSETKFQNLPPCYLSIQFTVIDGTLHLQATQRSGDMFLGVPYDIMNFALFLNIFAYISGLRVGTVSHKINDAHIYLNHINQCNEYLLRRETSKKFCSVYDDVLDNVTHFGIKTSKEYGCFDMDKFLTLSENMEFENMQFENYNSMPFIKAEVSI